MAFVFHFKWLSLREKLEILSQPDKGHYILYNILLVTMTICDN